MRSEDLLNKFKDRNIYEELSVSETADMKIILTAYRKKALSCHPDKNKSDGEALDKFHDLLYIVEILENTETRKIYDKQLGIRRRHKDNKNDDEKRKQRVEEMKNKLAEEIRIKREREQMKKEEELKLRQSKVKEERFRDLYIKSIINSTLFKNSHKEAVRRVDHLDLEQVLDNVTESFTDDIGRKFAEEAVPEVNSDYDYDKWTNIYWHCKSIFKDCINEQFKDEIVNAATAAAVEKVEKDCYIQNKESTEKDIEAELARAFDKIEIDIHDKKKTPEKIIIFLIKSAELGFEIARRKNKRFEEISKNDDVKIENIMMNAAEKYINDAREDIITRVRVSKMLKVIFFSP